MNYVYSLAGYHLTEQFESLRLKAYQDTGGVWTIGYGHTGSDVKAGLLITPVDAYNFLRADVASAAKCVNDLCANPNLTQQEFDALVDFTFNVGPNAFRNSTLLVDLNAGRYAEAAKQFEVWDHCGGKVVAGLLRRRLAEETLFNEAA